jgi:pimeloyl-ACP methyl ester carboxylesterase
LRPVLLLLSGLLCDETAWADVATRLPSGWDVRILSFPGRRSIGEMAQDALAAAPERFSVAGHSMGGRVALEMIRRAPERVERIALLNTGVHAAAEHEPASRSRLVDMARSQGMGPLGAAWLPPMMSPAGVADAVLMARLQAMVERSTPDSFTGQIQALLDRPDAGPVLPTIAVPTLLLSGTEDRWSPPAQHEAMQDRIAGAQLTVVEGAGHFAPVERPDEVAAALAGWMARDLYR